MGCNEPDRNKMEWSGMEWIDIYNETQLDPGHKTYIEKQSVLPIKATDKG